MVNKSIFWYDKWQKDINFCLAYILEKKKLILWRKELLSYMGYSQLDKRKKKIVAMGIVEM